MQEYTTYHRIIEETLANVSVPVTPDLWKQCLGCRQVF